MKVNIYFDFVETAYGGGNQFLKALREFLRAKKAYTNVPSEANVILFNSHHKLNELVKLKRKMPNTLFIHRLDGPISVIRDGKDLALEKLLYKHNDVIADGTIFQSTWSKQQNYTLGLKPMKNCVTILNAPNKKIFNAHDKVSFSSNKKIKLIATSWSSNWKKGFEVYQWLDNHLDFKKYEMTFIGNSPVNFKNIKSIKPLPSLELAKRLKKHDIFITASQKDPCSNSLIEALHCELPVLALEDGGHPEIVQKGGETFRDTNEILHKLEKIVNNYQTYVRAINLPTIDMVGKAYYDFILKVYEAVEKKEYSIKWVNFLIAKKMETHLVLNRIQRKIHSILGK